MCCDFSLNSVWFWSFSSVKQTNSLPFQARSHFFFYHHQKPTEEKRTWHFPVSQERGNTTKTVRSHAPALLCTTPSTPAVRMMEVRTAAKRKQQVQRTSAKRSRPSSSTSPGAARSSPDDTGLSPGTEGEQIQLSHPGNYMCIQMWHITKEETIWKEGKRNQ